MVALRTNMVIIKFQSNYILLRRVNLEQVKGPIPNGHIPIVEGVVGYVISNTLDTSGCIECFNLAQDKDGQPHILNSDQGSQVRRESCLK